LQLKKEKPLFLGKVIGNIWATQKNEALKSFKLLFVQPINGEYEELGEPIVAVDTVGVGPGEIIFYITASEAVIPLPVDMAPVDASIVGIVDTLNLPIKLDSSKTKTS
jgi:ethanolamine utilization protein EutN